MLSGDLLEARKILKKGLGVAVEANVIPIAIDILLGLAQCHARDNQPQLALELCYRILRHPATTLDTQDLAQSVCRSVEARLSAQQIAAAHQRAQLGTHEPGLG
jgi:hypothetical protein